MNCPACKTRYNESQNVPRLLVFCGHSLCEPCLKAGISKEGKAKCMECGKSEASSSHELSGYPKNLALLDLHSKK